MTTPTIGSPPAAGSTVVAGVVPVSGVVPTPFPGKVLPASKVGALEKRLIGVGGSSDSQDSFQLSSVVGFAPPIEPTEGRIGFEHFQRAGQTLTTPQQTNTQNNTPRSMSPNGAAQHSSPNVDSQGLTRPIDYNAVPSTLVAGLVAGVNGIPGAPLLSHFPAIMTTILPTDANPASTATPTTRSTPTKAIARFPLPPPNHAPEEFQLPPEMLSPTSPRITKKKTKGGANSDGTVKTAGTKRKSNASTGSPSPTKQRKSTTAATKKPKLPPTSLVGDFGASARPGVAASVAPKPSTTVAASPNSPQIPTATPVSTPTPAAPIAPAAAAAAMSTPPSSPRLAASSTLSPPPNPSPAESHATPGSGVRKKDITSYFGGGSGSGSAIARQASFLQQSSHHPSHSQSHSTVVGSSAAMDVDDSTNTHTPISNNRLLSPDLDLDSDSEVVILDAVSEQTTTTQQAAATPAARTTATAAAGKEKKPRSDKGKKKVNNKDSVSPLSSSLASSSMLPLPPAAAAGGVGSASNSASSSVASLTPADSARLRDAEQALLARERALFEREAQLEQRVSQANLTQSAMDDLQARLTQTQVEFDDHRRKVSTLLQGLFRELCVARKKVHDEQLLRDSMQIGRVTPRVDGGLHLHASVREEWEEGQMVAEVREKVKILTKEKEELTQAKNKIVQKRKALNRLSAKRGDDSAAAAAASSSNGLSSSISGFTSSLGLLGIGGNGVARPASTPPFEEDDGSTMLIESSHTHAAAAASSSSSGGGVDRDGFKRPAPLDTMHSLFEQDEALSVRLLSVKNSLAELDVKLHSFEAQRRTLMRQTKLQNDWRLSKFRHHPTLNDDRYIILELLGKGGFSEVYKAFDLHELRYVACKIHQLNSNWSESRKMNYTRHATREYTIHRSLHHPKVVQLFDVFAIDINSFCTVLEFCDGNDLDMYLKSKHTLSERESRSIIAQVFAGLKYLNEQKQKVIHYDLKPGNILFHDGQVKITDFGLSKVTPEGSTDGIELTSQGSGTYWYLPPECFGQSPIISSAVDVWSAGVVLYQMVYGRKPFGHGLTPDALLSSRAIQDATLEFQNHKKDSPLTPTQEFIKACLRINPHERPNILNILQDKYFSVKMS